MKYCFVHIMRTGGAYTVRQIKNEGVKLYCSWDRGLERDWNRAEIFTILRNKEGFIHNHVANWDEELIQYAKKLHWQIFTIIRNPCLQLISLWKFLKLDKTNLTLDQFVLDQLNEQLTVIRKNSIDFHSWVVPNWWREIDVILHFRKDLYCDLKRIFNLKQEQISNYENNIKDLILSEDILLQVRQHKFYKVYEEASTKSI